MNSLFGRIILWFWLMLVVFTIGSALISALSMETSDRRAPGSRMILFDLREARNAYETGGRPGLQAFMTRLHSVYEGRAILTDQSGRDLLTGENRSDLVSRARKREPVSAFRVSPALVARTADDGQYWFFYIMPIPRVGSWFLRPEHLWELLAGILLCYALAFQLTRPVRQLQRAVERFGHGDFSARAGSKRHDELGDLARTFDRMADRIEALVSAERRLLLDISHELRSPLARLSVAVELARSGEDLDSHLNRIQREADRLNSLVGGLLQVTRAEVDPAARHTEPVPVADLLAQLVEDAGIEARARHCSVALDAPEPVTVSGDPELLRRAVENVLRNAIAHAPEGTTVDVRLDASADPVRISIRDHGPGVPDAALPRLFDAFYRVETDRGRASGGTGLGLSIARRAVELHRGAISASNAHPGLLVEITLPRTEPRPEASAALQRLSL